MIVRPRPHWLRMLFIWRGSVIKRILPQLVVSTAIAAIVTRLHGQVFGFHVGLTPVPFTLLGITLAIFLGFRNTVSYERYWDARKLWGGFLNDTRTAARQVLSLCDAEATSKKEFVYGLIAVVHAVKHQLRRTSPTEEMAALLSADWQGRLTNARFPSAVLLMCLGARVGEWLRGGALSPILTCELDRSLSRLTDDLGGCERIASTPIPFAYSVLLHRTIYIYCVLLPFGLVDSIGSMTIIIVTFVSYTFFALDALAQELEEPFGLEPNDLALDAMSRSIEISLREMLGETDLPLPLAPDRQYVLT